MKPLTPAERVAEHTGNVTPLQWERPACPSRADAPIGASPRPRPRAARPVASRGARSTLTIITAVALCAVAAVFAVIGLALVTSPDSARAVVPLTLAAMFGYCVVVAIKGDE